MPLMTLATGGSDVFCGGHPCGLFSGLSDPSSNATTAWPSPASETQASSRSGSRLCFLKATGEAGVTCGQLSDSGAAQKLPVSICTGRSPSGAMLMDDSSGEFNGAEPIINEPGGEYLPELVDGLFRQQLTAMVDPLYLEFQAELNSSLRAMVIDWLVDVHERMAMQSSTLFLAANLIDRYLSQRCVKRGDLVLFAVAAFLIAAKVEEADPPFVEQLVAMTGNTSTKESIVRMECAILAALGFDVTAPTVHSFLAPFEHVNGCSIQNRHLARYMLELSLRDSSMLRFEPSRLAAGALLLANRLTGRTCAWPHFMPCITGCSAQALADICGELHGLMVLASTRSSCSVFKKYSKAQRASVARMFPAAPPL